MGAIIVGTQLFGAVDRVPSLGHVATQFVHLNYIPLVPLRSYVVFEGSEHGTEFRGKHIGLDWKSILIGYVRGWVGQAAAILCAISGAVMPLMLGIKDHPESAIGFVLGLGGGLGATLAALLAPWPYWLMAQVAVHVVSAFVWHLVEQAPPNEHHAFLPLVVVANGCLLAFSLTRLCNRAGRRRASWIAVELGMSRDGEVETFGDADDRAWQEDDSVAAERERLAVPPPAESLRFTSRVVAASGDGPGPRSRHGLAHDRGRGVTVLFGGQLWSDPPSVIADTWELQSGRWSFIECKTPPSPRGRHGFVYDPLRRQCILFGGFGVSGALGDTWTYDAAGWHLCRPRHAPPPRCGHAMAFCEASGAALVFGGISPHGDSLDDTWLFDGDDWRCLRIPGPSPRRYAGCAYHPALHGCILHGGALDDDGKFKRGDTWLFHAETWTPLSIAATAPRDDHALVYDPGVRALVMIGGLGRHPDLLLLGRDGWQPASTAPPLPTFQCAPAVFDLSSAAMILHGGEQYHGGPQFDQTIVVKAER